jgi:histidinol-phosphatase (PHP family)
MLELESSLFWKLKLGPRGPRECKFQWGSLHSPISFFLTFMPHSFHSHSGQFCKHAVGLLEDVVKEASNQGFEIYGLTEHAPRYRAGDLYPEEVMLSDCVLSYKPNPLIMKVDTSVEGLMLQFEAFLNEAHRLRKAYASSLRLLVGLETEYISPLDIDGLSKLLNSHKGRIDYIVGSVHHVNEIPIDFDLDTYRRCLDSIPLPAHVTDSTSTDQEHERLGLFFGYVLRRSVSNC